MENDLTAVIIGSDLRLALMDRRTELLRLSQRMKTEVFDLQIADIDRCLFVIDRAKEVTLSVSL